MRRNEDPLQVRRLAHRLHAVYICEMTGRGCIDPIYRRLRQKPPCEVFLRMAEDLLPKFHNIFIVQMDDSPGSQRAKQLIAFEELDAKKHKQH
jgi:hypothetical protein